MIRSFSIAFSVLFCFNCRQYMQNSDLSLSSRLDCSVSAQLVSIVQFNFKHSSEILYLQTLSIRRVYPKSCIVISHIKHGFCSLASGCHVSHNQHIISESLDLNFKGADSAERKKSDMLKIIAEDKKKLLESGSLRFRGKKKV